MNVCLITEEKEEEEDSETFLFTYENGILHYDLQMNFIDHINVDSRTKMAEESGYVAYLFR